MFPVNFDLKHWMKYNDNLDLQEDPEGESVNDNIDAR